MVNLTSKEICRQAESVRIPRKFVYNHEEIFVSAARSFARVVSVVMMLVSKFIKNDIGKILYYDDI